LLSRPNSYTARLTYQQQGHGYFVQYRELRW
jgi:hypothetical protein